MCMNLIGTMTCFVCGGQLWYIMVLCTHCLRQHSYFLLQLSQIVGYWFLVVFSVLTIPWCVCSSAW